MAQMDDLAERVDRLVVRHQELKRTSGLIAQQLVAVTNERDNLRARLAAARARIETLISRLPPSEQPLVDGEFGAHAFEGPHAAEGAHALHGTQAPGANAASAAASATSVDAGSAPATRGDAQR